MNGVQSPSSLSDHSSHVAGPAPPAWGRPLSSASAQVAVYANEAASGVPDAPDAPHSAYALAGAFPESTAGTVVLVVPVHPRSTAAASGRIAAICLMFACPAA